MARRVAFLLLCLALAAGFAGLGAWQVKRRAWKLDLIARVDARIHAPPAALPPRAAWSGDLQYTHVRVTGRWLPDRTTLVQAVTELGGGHWVLTPLATGAGTLIVNRGFVPPERTATLPPPAGDGAPVTLTGLIRATEPGGGFLRRNDPAADRWYSRDVAAIARARRLADPLPFFVDADATPAGTYPVGGLTVVSFPNNHLMYAITWFALAALSLGGAVLVGRRR